MAKMSTTDFIGEVTVKDKNGNEVTMEVYQHENGLKLFFKKAQPFNLVSVKLNTKSNYEKNNQLQSKWQTRLDGF